MENRVNENCQGELDDATFAEKLCQVVTFEAYMWNGKYRYRASDHFGHSISFNTYDLLSPKAMGRKMSMLSGMDMPKMTKIEYGRFAQAVMDASTVIDEKSHYFDSKGYVFCARRING